MRKTSFRASDTRAQIGDSSWTSEHRSVQFCLHSISLFPNIHPIIAQFLLRICPTFAYIFNIFLPRYLGHGVIATKLRRHWEEFVPLQQEIRLTQCVTACRFAGCQDIATFYQLDWRNEGKFDISGQTRPASYAASWEAQSPGESDRKIKDQNPSRFHRQQLTRIWEVMAHKQVIQCSRNMLGNYIFCPFFLQGKVAGIGLNSRLAVTLLLTNTKRF